MTVIPGGFLGFCDKKQGKSCQNLVALFSFAAKVLLEMYIHSTAHKKGIYYVHHAIDCSLLEVGICKYIPTTLRPYIVENNTLSMSRYM